MTPAARDSEAVVTNVALLHGGAIVAAYALSMSNYDVEASMRAAALALTTCQGVLLAAWLALATHQPRVVVWRPLALVVMLFLLILLGTWASRLNPFIAQADQRFLAVAWAQLLSTLAISGVCFSVFRREWRWHEAPVGAEDRWRYSIGQVLVATILLAVFWAAARHLQRYAGSSGELIGPLPLGPLLPSVAASAFTVSALFGLIVCIGPRPLVVFTPVVVAGAYCAGQSICLLMKSQDVSLDLEMPLTWGPPTAALLTIATALILRDAGLRLDRTPRTSAPPRPAPDALAPEPSNEPAS